MTSRGRRSSSPVTSRSCQRHILALARRGRLEEAHAEWSAACGKLLASEARPSEDRLARDFHLVVARSFLERAELSMAEAVLRRAGAPGSDLVEVQEAWNRLRYRQEAEELGAALFPEDRPFETRWAPDFGASEEVRREADQRFLGRVASITEGTVVLEMAPPPEGEERPSVLRVDIGEEAFCEAANLQKLQPEHLGAFVEVLQRGQELMIKLRTRVVP